MGSSVMLETSGDRGSKKKSKTKKRRAPEPEVSVADKTFDKDDGEPVIDFSENEPTMADKLASLDIVNKDDTKDMELEQHQEPTPTQPPSADSVHVLLKQALHADDKALLLDCLYNQDQKVITNSVALLSASDIFKLFNSLLSITQSRGAILVCALPWLKSLVLQHASRVAAHESSLVALNSLYQLIESRVQTQQPAMDLASSLDSLYVGVIDDVLEDQETVPPPVVYYDYDDSDEEEDDESEDEKAMETVEESDEVEGSSVVSDADSSDEDMDY